MTTRRLKIRATPRFIQTTESALDVWQLIRRTVYSPLMIPRGYVIGPPLRAPGRRPRARSGGRVYVALTSGALVAVDVSPSTGSLAEAWRTADVSVGTALALDGAGGVLFGDPTGRLHMLRDLGPNVSISSDDIEGVVTEEPVLDSAGRLIATRGDFAPAAVNIGGGVFVPELTIAAEDVLLGVPLLTASGYVLFRGGSAVLAYRWQEGTLTPVWRWDGIGSSPTALNITERGDVIIGRQPDTVLRLTPGFGGLAPEVWARHRRDAGSSAGFDITTPGTGGRL